MTALPSDAVADLYKLVAELEQRLESSFAAHDAAIARAAAMDAENGRLINELSIAHERQNASAEILSTIANTSGDAERALYQIAETSARLFGAPSATIHIAEGDGWAKTIRFGDSSKRVGAGVPDAQLKIGGRNMPGTIVGDNRQVNIPDVDNVDPAISDWPGLPYVREAGTRSMSGSPLRREGKAIGALIVYRDRLMPFTEAEMALQQTFADQAAIAIENARLFNETREALERQTATADILKVIASSPSDTTPVFDAIAHSARRLLGGFSAAMFRYVDGMVHLAAFTPVEPAADAALRADFPAPVDDFAAFRLARDGQPFAIPDTEELSHTPVVEIARKHGFRSMLWVPMVSGGVPIGLLSVTRAAPGAFAPHHTQLLQTFADQAVIAIENARLFNETREALEQQQASANILRVVSNSVADTQPVFEEILNSIEHLFDAEERVIFLAGNDGMQHIGAIHGPSAEKVRAQFPAPLEGTASEIALRERRLVSSDDVFNDPEIPEPARERARQFGSNYAMVVAPMLWEDRAVGSILVARASMAPFSEKECNLLRSFADQAVIAIQNARLFNEVQQRTNDLTEALTYQTGSGKILSVIASSPTEVGPVLNAIVESACELCEANDAVVFLENAGELHSTAHHGPIPEGLTRLPITRTRIVGRAFLDRIPVHVRDFHSSEGDEFPDGQIIARRMGHRTMLSVPLLREGESIGVIVLRRNEVHPFSEKQISLLQTFADQAVIAIGNVRLFDEVQAKTRDLSEALTYQTGSAKILSVIASSPTEVDPVLGAIVESACELCEAYDAVVLLKDGDHLRFSAHHGPIAINVEKWPIGRGWAAGRAFLDRIPVHMRDMLSDEGAEFPDSRELSRHAGIAGVRSILAVPLLSESESIGTILLRRVEVHPFSDKQIALLQTFADQAVIAIGNVRLFDEVQARTRDLSEALTYQTGSANILKVIASSPTDVNPVLKAIVGNARDVCDAYDAAVVLKDGDDLRFSAHEGPIPIGLEKWPINRRWTAGRAVLDRQPVHVQDLQSDEAAEFSDGRQMSIRMGHRSILSVPLLREGESIGAIVLRRTEVNPFSDKQIALLQTFADQAVIAIGNVRLFEEVQARTRELSESLEQQTATSEVLSIISRSAGDLQPVFQSMLENATRICGAEFGLMNLYEDGSFHTVGFHNVPPAFAASRQQSFRPHPDTDLSKMVRTKKLVQIDDLRTRSVYLQGDPATVQLADLAGARTVLIVPMVKDDEFVGSIGIYRLEVSPFTEKQIALLSSFASQAVIAIENTRLLKELRERTDDLTKSLDDLRTAQDRLVQTEKLASLGQLTAGIAHEIKNPLNFVNNFAALSAELTEELNDLLKQATITEKIREEVDELTSLLKDNLQKVVQHGQRADSIVKNMLLHSREGSGDHRPTDINALVDESLNLAYHGARAERPDFNVTLQRDFDAGAGMVEVFPQEITRVFLNLVSNGFYAVAKRKRENANSSFDPILSATTRNLGDAVEIRIRDNGTGIPPEVKDKMFNPFFTTKPAGEGTGLGLSMSHDIIVKQHGGTIDVDTEPGQFTEFRIVLPRNGTPPTKARGQS